MIESGIGVSVRYADCPPVGEVLLRIGSMYTRLDPENAEIIGNGLLAYAKVAREMTEDAAADPRLALGIIATEGGGKHT